MPERDSLPRHSTARSEPARSLNEPIRAMCTTHPERVAIAENDMRTNAMCRECYAEWLKLWKGAQ